MKSLFEISTLTEILQRLDRLEPATQHQWGTMGAAQMLAHCCATMEMANGSKTPPRTFLGYLLGPLFKPSYLGEKPFPHNSPTDKTFIVSDSRDFSAEKARLVQMLQAFNKAGEAGATRHPHAFFGTLTPDQWGTSMYKHTDHHLRQFGV